MNICILNKVSLAHSIGGMETHAKTLSEGFARKGHRVTLITTRHPGGIEEETANGVRIYYLKHTTPGVQDRKWQREVVRKFEELHSALPFDALVSESACGYPYVVKLKKRLGVPFVSVMHGYPVTGEIVSEWNKCSHLKEFALFFLVKLPEIFLRSYPWFRLVLRHSDAVIGVSKEVSLSVQRVFHVPADRSFAVVNGVDLASFRPDMALREKTRARYGIKTSDKVLCMAGVVHKQKGMHIGLEAFRTVHARMPSVRLIIAGDGPDLPLLKTMARRLGVEGSVIFCGAVPNTEIPAYLNASDVFLNPTMRIEGLPIVIVEALACGKPVIAHRIGGIPTVVENGVNGVLLAPSTDSAQLARKTIEILSDSSLLEKLAQNAQARSLRELGGDTMTDEYLSIIKKTLMGKEQLA